MVKAGNGRLDPARCRPFTHQYAVELTTCHRLSSKELFESAEVKTVEAKYGFDNSGAKRTRKDPADDCNGSELLLLFAM